MSISEEPLELTILMPCLNEAETVATCIGKARSFLDSRGVLGEIVVADNGSSDDSQAIALRAGARVVPVTARGYGAALNAGILAARSRYIVMADADDSYDFSHLDAFLRELRAGKKLVMGNRFLGGIAPGAMPPLHYFLGNPVLSFIGRLFFQSPVRDFHCGLRGFDRAAILSLDLQTTGMEFASEMVVKATLAGLDICEVPTTLSQDGRSRPPHLRSWRDGWRHLRFLLMYCPRWLFLLPGIALMLLGLSVMLWLGATPKVVGGIQFDIHTLLAGSGLFVIGFQAVVFALLTKVFATGAGLLPEDPLLNKVFKYVTLEVGICIGMLLILLSIAGGSLALWQWRNLSFGSLRASQSMRIFIPVVTAAIVGSQTILASFYFSILGLRRKSGQNNSGITQNAA